MSIFANLPNNIIIHIVREADGGLNAHKKKAIELFKMIRGEIPCGKLMVEDDEEDYGDDDGIISPSWWSEQQLHEKIPMGVSDVEDQERYKTNRPYFM